MKNFRIVVEMNEEETIFETANSEKKIDKLVEFYAQDKPQAIKIYSLDKETNQYTLTRNLTKRPAPQEKRLIGFGRW